MDWLHRSLPTASDGHVGRTRLRPRPSAPAVARRQLYDCSRAYDAESLQYILASGAGAERV
jgi:hypothetical protein